jgi:hypothetical protein
MPQQITVNIRNVCGEIDSNAAIEVRDKAGHQVAYGAAPAIFNAQESDKYTLTANALGYYQETGSIAYSTTDGWITDNPSFRVSPALGGAQELDVFVGRIGFANVAKHSGTDNVPHNPNGPTKFDPGGVLLNATSGYRSVWDFVQPRVFRTLKNSVVANKFGRSWDRFNFNETALPLWKWGTWLFLEYGDPPDFGNQRQLIGVWAPFRAEATPNVVVQITPNTFPPYYPADTFPTTGIYPFQCNVKQPAPPSKQPLTIASFDQPYPELGSTRSLTVYRVVHQIYGARTAIYGHDLGPIVITPIPALIRDGNVAREPLNCREGLGRLIGEVLRFLWARKITSWTSTAGGGLVFSSKSTTPSDITTEFKANSTEDVPAKGFPASCRTTLLGHSAAVQSMLDIVKFATLQALLRGASPATGSAKRLPSYLPRPPYNYYGGTTPYMDANWAELWLIDTVMQPNRLYSPTQGSPTAAAWNRWRAEQDQRRICAVYSGSGIAPTAQNGLIASNGPITYPVEEKRQGNVVAWLRFSNAFLAAATVQTDDTIRPLFTIPVRPRDTHNEIYCLGVGYAAQAFL